MDNAPPEKIGPFRKRKGLKKDLPLLSSSVPLPVLAPRPKIGGRLPGFIGPFPPPLWIRVCLKQFLRFRVNWKRFYAVELLIVKGSTFQETVRVPGQKGRLLFGR
jgi:hypothetical protein